MSRQLTVTSNLTSLEETCVQTTGVRFVPMTGGSGVLDRARAAWRALRCDYAVVNCAPTRLFELCLCQLFVPFSRCRIVSLDTVLPVPRTDTVRQRLALRVKRRLFRQVHLFIEYFRETEGYERHYRIPRGKFRYVPFKINRYEKVLHTATRDGGYIFCGGNTRRDFATLIEAVRPLPYPVRVVTMQESVIRGHGSSLAEQDLPPNVEVVRHDGSDSFLEHVANARLAVLPIRKENISASGIGVYLVCMALGKCVVISAGPAVNGVVPPGAAIVVPPEDVRALRDAIRDAWHDDGLRTATAEAGRRYALSLGGEARLCQSVLEVVRTDATGAAGLPHYRARRV